MLRSLFVLSILLPGVVLAFTSRFRALLLYTWFAFFRPQEWLWANIRSFRLSLVIGLILVVPAIFTGVFPNVTHPLSIGTLLFLLSGLLAQTNAVDPATGWHWIDFQAAMTVFCLLTITIVRTPRQLMLVIAVAAGSLTFFSAKAGFMSLISGGKQYADGLAGAFVDNNGWAVGIVMTIPFLVALAQNAELTFGGIVPKPAIRWVRFFWYLTIPLSAYTIVSTFSRGGFLALVAILLTYALFHPRRIRFVLIMGLLGGLLFVIPLPEGYLDRISTIQQLQEDVETPRGDVTTGRFYFWGVAMTMVQDYPLGVGMRNFYAHYGAYDIRGGAYGRRRDVHSSHFQVLVEQGYLGAAVWIWLFAYSLLTARRVRKRSRTPGLAPADAKLMETLPLAIVVSMAGFCVGGGAVSMALNDLTWLTFALLASLDLLSKSICMEATAGGRSAIAGPGAQAGKWGRAFGARGSAASV
jgi:probable O-glycosylation ligase (exosortase A-associated)